MRVAIDFETYYDTEYSVKNVSPWAYCHDKRFDPYLISVSDGSQTWAGPIDAFNWDALEPGVHLFSHNALFDRTVYSTMVERGSAPPIAFSAWDCTANLTSYLCNRRSLAASVEHLLKIHVSKAVRNDMKGLHWPDIQQRGLTKQVIDYAMLDARHCWTLADKYFDSWPVFERDLSRMNAEQGMRGIRVNEEKLESGIQLLKLALFKIESQLPWFSKMDFKPTSPKSIAEECRKVGIPCPPVKSHENGEEDFQIWELQYKATCPWIPMLSYWRSLNKMLATFENIKNRMRTDGTINFGLKYFGAHTGRLSGESGLNMQNLRKDPLLFNAVGEFTEDPAATQGIDVRALFIPREGKKFIICDLAQIEPRVLNWLAGNFALLEKIKSGMSIYEAHARETLGWAGGDLQEENKTLYKLAKARCLALGYGCGEDKYVVAAKTLADYDVTPEEASVQVPEFRKQNPKIVGLWARLDTAMKQSLGQDFCIELPSGRLLRYDKIRRMPVQVKDRKTGEMRQSMKFTADIGGMRKTLYGGLLTENLTQAVARDVFMFHLLEAKKHGINALFSVHDEAIFEVDKDFPEAEIKKIMSTTPDWLPECPIACKAISADHYKK